MKRAFFILLFFSNLIAFCQKSYHFDYFTVYEYKKDTLDKNLNKNIYYSNSKDKNYLLSIIMKKDTIFSAILNDYSNELIFIYKDDLNKNNINDLSLFKSYSLKKYSLENCKKSHNSFYEINYDTIGNKKIICINRFKNSKKKKLINQSFFETTPTKISDNQHYNFGILVSSLWCNKFVLNNKELIKYSYFIENNKKSHLRKLLSIEKTDFNLNVSTNNNTTN